jgi:phage I-like protein
MIVLICDDRGGVMPGELLVMTAAIGESTQEIQLVPIGTWNGKGVKDEQTGQVKYLSFTVTPEHVAQMCENFGRLGRDVVVDFEHQTLYGEEAPAAGWIKQLINKGPDGLWAMVDWTERAKEYLSAREYRFCSPVFVLNGVDRVSGQPCGAMLLNAALTNDPFFSELKPIVSKSTTEGSKETSFTFLHKEKPMNTLIARLREIYQLAADATEEQIIAKVDEMHSTAAPAIAAKAEIYTVLGLQPTATIEEAKARIVVAKQDSATVQQLQTRLATLEAQQLDEKVEAVVAKAINQGKIMPATKEHMLAFAKKDLAGFEAYVAKAPVIAPVHEIGDPSGSQSNHSEQPTETDLVVAKNLGLTPEDLKKK